MPKTELQLAQSFTLTCAVLLSLQPHNLHSIPGIRRESHQFLSFIALQHHKMASMNKKGPSANELKRGQDAVQEARGLRQFAQAAPPAAASSAPRQPSRRLVARPAGANSGGTLSGFAPNLTAKPFDFGKAANSSAPTARVLVPRPAGATSGLGISGFAPDLTNKPFNFETGKSTSPLFAQAKTASSTAPPQSTAAPSSPTPASASAPTSFITGLLASVAKQNLPKASTFAFAFGNGAAAPTNISRPAQQQPFSFSFSASAPASSTPLAQDQPSPKLFSSFSSPAPAPSTPLAQRQPPPTTPVAHSNVATSSYVVPPVTGPASSIDRPDTPMSGSDMGDPDTPMSGSDMEPPGTPDSPMSGMDEDPEDMDTSEDEESDVLADGWPVDSRYRAFLSVQAKIQRHFAKPIDPNYSAFLAFQWKLRRSMARPLANK